MMKCYRVLLIFMFCFAGLQVTQAQNKIVSYTVPIDIHNEFMQLYRGASNVEWIMHDYVYEVEFMQYGEQKSFIYNQAGNIIEKRFKRNESKLSNQMLSYISSNYAGYQIEAVYERKVNKSGSYLVLLRNGNQKVDLIFDSFGNLKHKSQDWTNGLK